MEVPLFTLLLVFLISIGTLLLVFERGVKWFIFYLTTDIPGPTFWQLLTVQAKRLLGDKILECLFETSASYDFRPWGMWLYGEYFVFISDCDSISEVFKSKSTTDKPAFFYENMSKYMGNGLITLSGPQHKRHRRLLTPPFRKELLEAHLPRINEYSVQLMKRFDALANGETVDVRSLVEEQAIVIGSTILFSGAYDYHNPLQMVERLRKGSQLIHEMTVNPVRFWLTSLTNKNIEDPKCPQDELEKSFLDAKSIAKEIVRGDGRRPNHFEVMFQNHVEEGDEGFTESEYFDETKTLLVAASETTACAENACLHLLALHPEEQQRVYEEIESIFGNANRDVVPGDLGRMVYLEQVIKETLRLFPSVPMIGRRANEEIILNGVKVPKGAGIGVFLFALHRDPRLYEDPLKFDPKRFSPENCASRPPCAYAPFSGGVRNCIGSYQSYMVMKVFLSYVIRNFKVLPGEGLKNVEDSNVKLRVLLRFPDLPLRFVKRCCT